MPNDSDAPKFPQPIPNPLFEEEKTDPGLTEKPKAAPPPPSAAQAPATPRPPQRAPVGNPKMPDLGILNPLMKDPLISEIMVNDLRNIMIEREGQLIPSGVTFSGLDELNRITRLILDLTGRILSPEQPYADLMLPDGSRVNIVIPPLTLYGACMTIRKFPSRRYTLPDLVVEGELDQKMGYFLNACILSRMNILISGGTGSGKTTLLGALVALIPRTERIITIEDTPELAMEHSNSVRLQTKLHTPTSSGVSARDLVANSLRMRPDRIIIGECRRGEAFDMLQAMNTGHLGSMTTIHANSPRDALARAETLCLLSGAELPLNAIRRQMVGALDLVIQVRRFRNGKRRIVAITEVTGMEGETLTLQDIFLYDSQGMDESVGGQTVFRSTGLVPTFLSRMREAGIELPRDFFA